jgi:hypothetical protein
VNWQWEQAPYAGPPRVGVGPGEKIFWSPPARADWLKIVTLNQTDPPLQNDLGFM